VFDGFNYVALGHLHGPQEVPLAGSATRLAYSGSPLAYSFSERDHVKSVTLVELDGDGAVELRRIAAPVPRRLVQVSGELADLLARARGDLASLADCYVKVILTDKGRPVEPMAALRSRWPHTLVLEFAPAVVSDASVIDLRADARGADPAQIVCAFTEYVRGIPVEPELADLISELVSVTTAEQGKS
jgi:exonuclease SbcD